MSFSTIPWGTLLYQATVWFVLLIGVGLGLIGLWSLSGR